MALKDTENSEASHRVLSDYQALNRIAHDMHSIACVKGFHREPLAMGEACSNLHGEVSELWEAYRNNRLSDPCDKDCGLTCAEEELADIAIRVMDTAVEKGIDLGRAIELKAAYNRNRPYRHGDKKA